MFPFESRIHAAYNFEGFPFLVRFGSRSSSSPSSLGSCWTSGCSVRGARLAAERVRGPSMRRREDEREREKAREWKNARGNSVTRVYHISGGASQNILTADVSLMRVDDKNTQTNEIVRFLCIGQNIPLLRLCRQTQRMAQQRCIRRALTKWKVRNERRCSLCDGGGALCVCAKR